MSLHDGWSFFSWFSIEQPGALGLATEQAHGTIYTTLPQIPKCCLLSGFVGVMRCTLTYCSFDARSAELTTC